MNKIDRIIDIIRQLHEEAPTTNVGGGQIAGTSEAGDDPPVYKKNKKYLYLGTNSRKPWIRCSTKDQK